MKVNSWTGDATAIERIPVITNPNWIGSVLRVVVILAGILSPISGFDAESSEHKLAPPATEKVAAPDSNPAQPTSLCDCEEIVLFSGNIGDKKLSLCGVGGEGNKPLLIQYRFGKVGAKPELVYPSKPSEPLSSFDFNTVHSTSVISFERPGAAYDIMTPDKSDYVRSERFSGVVVTTGGKTTKLLPCEEGTVTVNLAPLRKALGLSPRSRLSDALPAYQFEKSPYPMRKKKSRECKCVVEYPDVHDPVVAAEIKSFTRGFCKEGEECQGTESEGTVTAMIVGGAYLTLTFSTRVDYDGAAHPMSHDETELFRKGKKGWERLKKEDLLKSTEKCEERIDSLLYRQVRPQLSELDSQDGLFNSAQIEIGSQGLIFSYQPYEFGAYIGPAPALLPYKILGDCLRLKMPKETDNGK
jgi:hypothetical protein